MILRFFMILMGSMAVWAGEILYPAVFASLGDPVYQAANGYRALLTVNYFHGQEAQLQHFVDDAETARLEGLALERDVQNREKRLEYIAQLRALDTRRQSIDTALLQEIKLLFSTSNTAVLGALQENPYGIVRDVAQQQLAKVDMSGKTLPPIDLKRSLEVLKSWLLQARDNGDPFAECLNNVTAINYWMVSVKDAIDRHEWCHAYEMTVQLGNFETAARKSCGRDNLLYREWSKRSDRFRTAIHADLKAQCRALQGQESPLK